MNQIVVEIATVIGILACAFGGPSIALYFLIRRKRIARLRRRSPLVANLLRPPGYTLLEQLLEAQSDFASDIALLVVIPLLTLSIALGQIVFVGLASPAIFIFFFIFWV